MSKSSSRFNEAASSELQQERATARVASFEKLVTLFEQPDTQVTLQNIHRVVRQADNDPLRAIALIAAKQNSVAPPDKPEKAAKALSDIGTRFPQTADMAFLAILKNDDPASLKHAEALLKGRHISDPVGKIETSSSCIKEDLLSSLAEPGHWIADVGLVGPHTEAALNALCRLGNQKAEVQVRRIVRSYPQFASLADASFPAIAHDHKIKEIVKAYYTKQTSIDKTITALSDLEDGLFTDHMSRLTGKADISDTKKIFAALADKNEDDAIPVITEIGSHQLPLRLDAIHALEAMRHQSSVQYRNDLSIYDEALKSLLDATMDLDVIREIPDAQRSEFKDAFFRADVRKISPIPYANTFNRAVNHIVEGRSIRAVLIDFQGPHQG